MGDRAATEPVTGVTGVVAAVTDDTGRTVIPTRLVCVAGVDLGRVFRIGFAPAVIGRGPVAVDLRATDVSRSHARVWSEDDAFVLEDLGSANKTFVNGTQVAGHTRLAIGDRIQVGSTILIFTRYDELEERMRQLQRLEAMASLVGGLAHDFNNALQVIMAGLDHLDETTPSSAVASRETAEDMRRAAVGASHLAKRLLNLGRCEPVAFDLLELGVLVDETVAMARHLVGEEVTFSATVAADARVHGSRHELQQVLLNLFLNARDAMLDGGGVTITAQVVRFDRANALARYLPSEGDYVEMAVTDTGVGMDDATIARVFEPFFTTKPPGKGTGLGLTMIYGTVSRHGGCVQVESVLGSGTTVRMWVPRAVFRPA